MICPIKEICMYHLISRNKEPKECMPECRNKEDDITCSDSWCCVLCDVKCASISDSETEDFKRMVLKNKLLNMLKKI